MRQKESMNPRRRIAFWVGAFVASLVVPLVASVPGRGQPPTKRKTLNSGKYSAVVTFTTVRVAKEEAESWWGGWFDKEHLEVVRSVRMFRGKEAVYIPVSAIVGLANVRQVSLTSQRNGCRLLLGDGGASYHARVTVTGTAVTERLVWHGEFPEECWEKTTYAYVPDDSR